MTGHQLHDSFSGSQPQAAVNFLHAHPGQVSPITLTLSGDDFPLLLGPCPTGGQIDPSCVQAGAPAFIAGLSGRISNILHQLRSAEPNAEIIPMGWWDSFVNAYGTPIVTPG